MTPRQLVLPTACSVLCLPDFKPCGKASVYVLEPPWPCMKHYASLKAQRWGR